MTPPLGLGDPLDVLRTYTRSRELGTLHGSTDREERPDDGSDALDRIPPELARPLERVLPTPHHRSGGAVKHYRYEGAPPGAGRTEVDGEEWLVLDGAAAPAALPEPLSAREVLSRAGASAAWDDLVVQEGSVHTRDCAPTGKPTTLEEAVTSSLGGHRCLTQGTDGRALLLVATAAFERIHLAAVHTHLTWRGEGYVYRWDRHGQPYETLAALLSRAVTLTHLLPEVEPLLADEHRWVRRWHQEHATGSSGRGRRERTSVGAAGTLVAEVHAVLRPHRSDRYTIPLGPASPYTSPMTEKARRSANALRELGEQAEEILVDLRSEPLVHALRHRILQGFSPEMAVEDCERYGPDVPDREAALEEARRWEGVLNEVAGKLGEVWALVPAARRSAQGVGETVRSVRAALQGDDLLGATRWETVAGSVLADELPSTGCRHPDLGALAVASEVRPIVARDRVHLVVSVPRAVASEAGSRYLPGLGASREEPEGALLELAVEMALADPASWSLELGAHTPLEAAAAVLGAGSGSRGDE